MIAENYSEIPRIFTSIAEVTACLIYILPLKKKHTGIRLFLRIILGIIALVLIQLISGELPVVYWIPGMLSAMVAMYLLIFSVCDLSYYSAGFLFVRAFLLAEFVASFEWQIYYFLIYKGISHSWWLAIIVMIIVYLILFALIYWIDARKGFKDNRIKVTLKELINALIIGFATFSINNINFVIDNPFVVNNFGANIMYVRTLIDLSGLLILFAWTEQRREIFLNHELKAINNILHRHYNQYQISKDSMDMINRKYHDLKHQIEVIKAEKDPKKIDEYFEEINYAIGVYGAQYDTGNKVLDTILTGKSLYCNEHDIKLSCVVNGELLDFMLVMDICSIFGNALDNSIESVEKIDDNNKRIISVAVFSKNNFLMMRFENYYKQKLVFRDGMPMTTKSDSNYHGYGIMSIKKTIEKYDGNLTINSDNNWFVMKVLIPLQQDKIEK